MSPTATFPISAVGTLALCRPEDLEAASKLIRRGLRFRLDLPINEPSPPLFGRPPMDHRVLTVEGFENASDDVIDNFNTQASTHWDALRHMAGDEGHFDKADPEDLGIDRFADGIVGRAVLIDLPRSLGVEPQERRAVSGEEIDACAARQGVELRPRDIVLLRTGWLGAYLGTPVGDRPQEPAHPGIESSDAMFDWLRRRELVAIAADQLTVEVFPVDVENMLHERIIPKLGIAVGELFWLDDLAADCAETGDWDSLLVSVPLRLPRGCASPANALALR
jgi:kynurenine formamidase